MSVMVSKITGYSTFVQQLVQENNKELTIKAAHDSFHKNSYTESISISHVISDPKWWRTICDE